MTLERPIYVCNPLINTECKKSGCGFIPTNKHQDCFFTFNPAYAELNYNNEPVRVDLDYNQDEIIHLTLEQVERLKSKPSNRKFRKQVR